MKTFFLHFFRHCAWALSAFCVLAFAMEWLIPDSVTPYIHLVPFAIVASLMLFADAIMNHERSLIVERVVLTLIIVALICIIFLSYRGFGMANLAAIAVMTTMLIGTGFVLLKKEED